MCIAHGLHDLYNTGGLILLLHNKLKKKKHPEAILRVASVLHVAGSAEEWLEMRGGELYVMDYT